MDNSKRKRTTTAPDVDALAVRAAKAARRAEKACYTALGKERQGGSLACALLGLAAVAADNHRAIAKAFGSKAETLLSDPLALIEAAATKPVLVEAGPATQQAEIVVAPTSTPSQEK